MSGAGAAVDTIRRSKGMKRCKSKPAAGARPARIQVETVRERVRSERHRAVLAIQDGSCAMAFAGGVNTIVSPEGTISLNKAGMLCEDGRCKTFSAEANGYVRAEGVGMLLLKQLQAAEAAGDHIYGVIRASAENHGGRANSLTAPNPKAQAELLKTAWRKAGIDPASLSYIEAHGTGTDLGDPRLQVPWVAGLLGNRPGCVAGLDGDPVAVGQGERHIID